MDKARPGVGGGSEEEIRQGKDKIAKSVSGKARTELARAADQTTTQVRSGVGQLRSGLYGPAREGVATKVGAAADQADRVLKQGLGTATRAIGDLTHKAKKSAGKARQTVVKGLRAARQEAIKNLDQWATSGRQRLHAVASQYRQAITASARHFSMGAASSLAPAAEVAGVQQEVDDALQGGTEGAVTGLLETTGGLREGMAQLAAQHAGAVSSAREAAQQGVSQVKTVTQAAQRRTGAGFLSTLQTTASQATAELTGAPSRVAGGLAPQHQTGVGGLAKTVDQAGTQQDRWTADARTRGERGASRLDSEASRLAGQAGQQEQAPVQRLFGFLGRLRNWLRDKLGDVLGGIISGIIQALPAIAIAVGLLLAGPVGWGVLAGLVIVGAGLGIYSRFQEYKADHGGKGPSFWEGVGLVGLGIADLTGIPYIVEASVGRRAFAPERMSTFERWERGTQGVIFLGLIAAGGAKKLLGKGPKPEVRNVSTTLRQLSEKSSEG